jgi:hypothetical protein
MAPRLAPITPASRPRRRLLALAAAVAAVVAGVLASAGTAAVAPPPPPARPAPLPNYVTNGAVNALARDGNTLFLGG